MYICIYVCENDQNDSGMDMIVVVKKPHTQTEN